MSKSVVTLLIPAYTPNVRHQDDAEQDSVQSPTSVTNLEFSTDQLQQPWQSQLAQCLGLDTLNGLYLPSAVLGLPAQSTSRSAEHSQSSIYPVRADPIYLKADRDNATLIPPEQLALSEAEADELLSALNDFVQDDGLVFVRQGVDEWFMSGLSANALRSYPPSFLANRNASSFLPDGDAAKPWRRLMTEIQMLFHTHPVNLQREKRGLMPVNSVWFWGGAPLPIASDSLHDTIVYADNAQAVQLAEYLEVPRLPLSAVNDAIADLPAEKQMVIIDTRIVQAWLRADSQLLEQAIERVNEQWLAPLSQLVAVGQLERIELLTEDGLQGECNAQTLRNRSFATGQGWLSRLRGLFR